LNGYVLRGGSWFDSDSFFMRAAFRGNLMPDDRDLGSGFRVVLRSQGGPDL